MAKIVLPRRSLVMVGGVPGSGKSYLLERVRTGDYVRILSADELRGNVQVARGFPRSAYVEECIEEARESFFTALHDAFVSEDSVLVEAAFLSKHSREEMIWWANERGYAAHMILVSATWAQCYDGNRARERSVPAGKLWEYYRQFEALEYQLASGKVDDGLVSAYVLNRDEQLDAIVFA